jgi:acyl-CoA thioester hydrolase
LVRYDSERLVIEAGLLEIGRSQTVGLVVSTACQFFDEVKFPDQVTCGLRLARIGNTSVVYELGLFRNETSTSFANGSFTHVYVNATTRRPVAVTPAPLCSMGP